VLLFFKCFPGRIDALAEADTEIPTAVGRGHGRQCAHVDALSNDKADTEIPTAVGRGRGRVGGRKYLLYERLQKSISRSSEDSGPRVKNKGICIRL
jgi:hypothetical protein